MKCDADTMDRVLQRIPAVEAMVVITPEGFPADWRARAGTGEEVEELAGIASTLFSAARQPAGAEEAERPALSIWTDHGRMLIGQLEDENVLLVLTAGEPLDAGLAEIVADV